LNLDLSPPEYANDVLFKEEMSFESHAQALDESETENWDDEKSLEGYYSVGAQK